MTSIASTTSNWLQSVSTGSNWLQSAATGGSSDTDWIDSSSGGSYPRALQPIAEGDRFELDPDRVHHRHDGPRLEHEGGSIEQNLWTASGSSQSSIM